MNIPPVIKKLFQTFRFLRHMRFTHVMILTYAARLLAVFILAMLGWDAYLFMQSLAPIQSATIQESKKISLTSEDIDEAIRIIDQRQQQFHFLLKEITGTTTTSF